MRHPNKEKEVQMNNNELKHYGVLGMKWGVRKDRGGELEKSNLRKQLDAAKKKKKYAEYKDFKSKRKAAYKDVKSKHKTAIKLKARELEKATPWKEKLLFNPATRELAAKYIVDNNLSVADATKRARRDALIHTAIFMAVFGAYAISGDKLGVL